ncbi:hypothetical protein JCM19992_12020 [Thermostilla marina]
MRSKTMLWVVIVTGLICLFGAVLGGLWGISAGAAEPNRPSLDFSAVFSRFDQNGDGRLTREEIPRAFDRLNADGDEFVTIDEAVAFLLQRPQRGAPRIGSRGAADIPPSVLVERNIPYAEGKSALRRLDVYRPKGAREAPVMIYVHGGGWRKGDKAAVHEKPAYFCGKGFVFVSVNYRLLPNVELETQVQDVADAVGWVAKHAEEIGGDANKLFLMGHSAGCHLVSLIATDERYLKKAGVSFEQVRGVIALDSQAYDLPTLIRTTGAGTYRLVFGDDPERLKMFSPQYHVAEGCRIPPFLICYSRGMTAHVSPLRRRFAERFAATLEEAGVSARVVDASDRSHGEINQWFGRKGDRVTEEAERFLDTILSKKDTSQPVTTTGGKPITSEDSAKKR